jgi:hypothetical protein
LPERVNHASFFHLLLLLPSLLLYRAGVPSPSPKGEEEEKRNEEKVSGKKLATKREEED